jgi:superfamily I DNA/RNA helicase
MATESTPEIEEERRLLYVAMTAIGGQIVQQRRGTTDCGQFCEAARAAPQARSPALSYYGGVLKKVWSIGRFAGAAASR